MSKSKKSINPFKPFKPIKSIPVDQGEVDPNNPHPNPRYTYKNIAKESPSEKLRKFSMLSDGMFLLDASDLAILADKPINVNIRDYMAEAYDTSEIWLNEEGASLKIVEKIEQLKAEYEKSTRQKKSEIDYELNNLLKSIEKFRKENRIKLSEDTLKERAESSSILDLDLDLD